MAASAETAERASALACMQREEEGEEIEMAERASALACMHREKEGEEMEMVGELPHWHACTGKKRERRSRRWESFRTGLHAQGRRGRRDRDGGESFRTCLRTSNRGGEAECGVDRAAVFQTRYWTLRGAADR